MSFDTYYTARPVLSKGAIFNYICSDRSDGKTFDCKIRALEDYALSRDITVYCRRFKTELPRETCENFFNDVVGDNKPEKQKYRDLYGKWKFKGSTKGVQVSLDDGKTWDWLIFFMPITMSGKRKSALDPFVQRIFTVDFDEYYPLDDRFAPNEMTSIIELWKSLDRDRDILQFNLLGNKIKPFSPFLDYFGIEVSIDKDKVRLYRDGTIAVQIYASKEHRTKRAKSRFSKAVEGTEYEGYNLGGVLDVLEIKIANHKGLDYLCSFKSERGEGTVWYNNKDFVVSRQRRKDGYVLTDKMYNLDREQYHITFGSFGKVFKNMYNTSSLFFEDEKSYYVFEPLLRKVWR